MIISHKHKFVFTAIPKTGTHSVRRALRERMGQEDVEQVGLFVQKRLPYPELAALQHGHISLSQVRPYLGETAFAEYVKFAFVRNPFDRFISYCAFMTRDDGAFERDPRGVMRYFLFQDRPLDHLLFAPQSTFVIDDKGKLLTDTVGRVEEMQTTFDQICARIGLASAPLEVVNASRRADYRTYYDTVTIDGVSEIYGRDLSLFGYSFDGASAR
jgi:sulfotransferase famil protein